jgi:MFS family permease
VLRPYRDLLSTPGAPAFSGAAFVARMPIAMLGLGVVLLVVAHDGSYGLAGALSATLALANALGSPVISRLVDRLGQRRVLLAAVALQGSFLVCFVALASLDAPRWSLFATVALAGGSGPPLGSLVRARWGQVLGPGPRLQTAYSYEAVLDEVIFVVGPLLVTVLATRLFEQAGLLSAVVLLVVGSLALSALRASEPPPVPGRDDRRSALAAPGMVAVVAMLVFVGGVIGGVEISVVGFADQHGHAALAGPLLACYAGGSLLAGLAYGAVHWRVALPDRLLAGAVVMTVTVAALPFVRDPAALAALLFVGGLGIAPTLISGLSLVERLVAPGQVTEGLTWATTGITVGLSLTSPVAGRLVDDLGAREAFTVAVASGLAAVVVGALGLPRMRAAPSRRATSPAAAPVD